MTTNDRKPGDPFDPPVPWQWYTSRHAARLLGVDRKFLSGLANNPIRSCVRSGRKTGGLIRLYNRDDVETLLARTKNEGS